MSKTKHPNKKIINKWLDGEHIQFKEYDYWEDFPDCQYMINYSTYSSSLEMDIGNIVFKWRVKPRD